MELTVTHAVAAGHSTSDTVSAMAVVAQCTHRPGYWAARARVTSAASPHGATRSRQEEATNSPSGRLGGCRISVDVVRSLDSREMPKAKSNGKGHVADPAG